MTNSLIDYLKTGKIILQIGTKLKVINNSEVDLLVTIPSALLTHNRLKNIKHGDTAIIHLTKGNMDEYINTLEITEQDSTKSI